MADVRLTATNPEDSSVVPVACDAAGRLLLEEPQVIEGPPGPRGEQGPPGQNGQDGDPFSGNFSGDVTFGGSASFAGGDFLINEDGSAEVTSYLEVNRTVPTIDTSRVFFIGNANGSEKFRVNVDGSAGLAGNVDVGGDVKIGGTLPSAPNISLGADGMIAANRAAFDNTQNPTAPIVSFYAGGNYVADISSLGLRIGGTAPSPTILVNANGSASFASNKAGFTAEGYLWCTTTRGDTVMLDFTTNGMAQWIPYTPTTRLEEIRDKLDANRGDTGEMPADTP